MSRKYSKILFAVVALCWLVAGSVLVWPNFTKSNIVGSLIARATAAGSPDGASFAAPDFHHAYTSLPDGLDRMYVPEFLLMADFERHFTGDNALPPREYVTVRMTAAVDFDRTFRVADAARRGDTPPNREALRNIGWRRVLDVSSVPSS